MNDHNSFQFDSLRFRRRWMNWTFLCLSSFFKFRSWLVRKQGAGHGDPRGDRLDSQNHPTPPSFASVNCNLIYVQYVMQSVSQIAMTLLLVSENDFKISLQWHSDLLNQIAIKSIEIAIVMIIVSLARANNILCLVIQLKIKQKICTECPSESNAFNRMHRRLSQSHPISHPSSCIQLGCNIVKQLVILCY